MTKKIKLITYAIILGLLQIADGTLTYIGVTMLGHGSNAEGNPIIKLAIDSFGAFNALFFIKLFSLLLVYILYKASMRVDRYNSLFPILITIYSFVVISWILILLKHL